MAGFLTHLMEGQNIAELNAMAVDGDPKHLGVVGRNLTIIGINERARQEMELAGARSQAESAELQAASSAASSERLREERQNDRMEALRRTGFKSLSKAERIAAVPDSDEAVDSFLQDLY